MKRSAKPIAYTEEKTEEKVPVTNDKNSQEAEQSDEVKKRLDTLEKKLDRMKRSDTCTVVLFILILIGMFIAKFIWNAKEMERKRLGI